MDKTNLFEPVTKCVSKYLLPLYDKPLIYYALSVLMQLDIKEILIIVDEKDIVQFQELLADGDKYGVNIQYSTKENSSNEVIEIIKQNEGFIGNDSVAIISADEVIINDCLYSVFRTIKNGIDGSLIFLSLESSNNIDIEIDQVLNASINSPHNSATLANFYIFDNSLIDKIKYSVKKPSLITDIIKQYWLEEKLLYKHIINNKELFHINTQNDLLDASIFIRDYQNIENVLVGSIDLIPYIKGWICRNAIFNNIDLGVKSNYGKSIIDFIDIGD